MVQTVEMKTRIICLHCGSWSFVADAQAQVFLDSRGQVVEELVSDWREKDVVCAECFENAVIIEASATRQPDLPQP